MSDRPALDTIINEDDYHPHFDESVPQSKGIPSFLPIIALIGLIGIFAIGTGVVLNAGWGHIWPSLQSTRINLVKK